MKVVILGVGNAQVDAIEYCKAQGWEVHGLSYRQEGAGLPLVDHFGLVNIIDAAAVQAYAESADADLIYSVGSDLAMPTIGSVCEQMNLPFFVNQKTTELLQNKGALRRYLRQKGISPLQFTFGQDLADFEEWTHYPAVIKPVDGQGQRGIYELFSFEHLNKYFPKAKSHSRCGEVIVEQYIDGPEISVNALVIDGHTEDNIVSDRHVVGNLPGGIPSGHVVPSIQTEEVQEKARELAKQCIVALDIKNGPVYFQMKVQGNEVFIIEITPRLDGCHMWRLIKYRYGIDLLEKTFSLLAGTQCAKPVPPTKGTWLLEFNLQKPWTIFEGGSDCLSVFSCNYYQKGETVRAINGHMEKTGYRIGRV